MSSSTHDASEQTITFVYTTWPDAETAETVGRRLIREGLAACVNIGEPVRSIYVWKGEVETSEETPMIVKTTTAKAADVEVRIKALHTAELPGVTAFRADAHGTSAAFAAWVGESVSHRE
jgi:periplasmic divalent cation tolerance protein